MVRKNELSFFFPHRYHIGLSTQVLLIHLLYLRAKKSALEHLSLEAVNLAKELSERVATVVRGSNLARLMPYG